MYQHIYLECQFLGKFPLLHFNHVEPMPKCMHFDKLSFAF